MIALTPLLMALLFTTAASLVGHASEARSARRLGVSFATAALALAVLLTVAGKLAPEPPALLHGIALHLAPLGALYLMPILVGMVGLLSLAMSPLETHPPRTLARTLALLAIALGCLATTQPTLLIVLWAGSSAIAWAELRDRAAALRADRAAGPGERPDRIFAAYHLPSVALVAMGVALFNAGLRSTGAMLVVLGMAIRKAVFPMHLWFPVFVARAPMGLVVAFAAPQLGIYAQLAEIGKPGMGLPGQLSGIIAMIAAVSALLAAARGIVQKDARRALAYLMMSQTAMVTFGLASASPVTRSGALLAFQGLGLSLSGLAMTLAALEARRGALSLRAPSGSFARTPRLSVAFLVMGFAMVGFPFFIGFVAEDLLVQGAIEASALLVVCVLAASALNGIAVMRGFFMLFAGRPPERGEQDLTRRESYALTMVMAALLGFGILPRGWVNIAAGESGAVERHVEPSAEHHGGSGAGRVWHRPGSISRRRCPGGFGAVHPQRPNRRGLRACEPDRRGWPSAGPKASRRARRGWPSRGARTVRARPEGVLRSPSTVKTPP
jgi:formate hydrogenlyase subunit 3/multisubunit Na+/H+ antiporter MnhD subunit